MGYGASMQPTSADPEDGRAARRPRARLDQLFITAVLLGVFLVLYTLAAHLGGDAPTTRLPLDDIWRLVPVLVWVYISPYFFGVFVIGTLPPSVFRAFVWRGVVIGTVHTAFNFLLPTRVDRPPLPDALVGPSASMLRLVYAVDDPPLNAAPSAHVSLTLLITWAAWRGLPQLRAPLVVWCAGVIASVLLTRQHHIVDVVTGVVLVGLVLLAFERRWHPPLPTS
jgi:membrane-associated phospholipid phosphatase